jgi:signal transduction histidine kinase
MMRRMSGVVATMVRPATSAASRRRAAHLFIGAGQAAALMLPVVAALELAPLAFLTPAAILAAGFSAALRALERAQANALLGTALAGVEVDGMPADRGPRRFDAAFVVWLVLRVSVGLAGTLALLAGAFALVAGAIAPFEAGFFRGEGYRSPSGLAGAWLPFAGLAVLLAAAQVADALGRLEARAAPRLLAPTAAEEIAALRARTRTLAERERLARELHDSVGHAVTVTLLQARAARRLLERDPAAADRALATIEELSETTMGELDQVLALLRREGSGGDAEDPGDVVALGRALREAGLPIDLHVDDAGELSALPARVRLAAFRIVQEAATNVLRHAGPVATRAELRLDGPDLVVRVTNARPAPGHDPHAAGVGTGRGLSGARDRARALGGEATFGPSPDGGWVVAARMPAAGDAT